MYPSDKELVNWEKCKRIVNTLTEKYSKETQLILAKLIINITDIIKWRNIAFRNCDRETMEKIFDIKELALTQADGNVYHPELDDIAACIDYPALHYAALKAAAIVQETADSLLFYRTLRRFAFLGMPTPYGSIVLYPNSGRRPRRPSRPWARLSRCH